MDSAPSTELAGSADVLEAAAAARAAGRFGIDTEFMSEGRYRALLCLVQVAVDNPDPAGEPLIFLIDSLADADVRPLAVLLADPDVEVVLHAGRQDVAILRRAWRTELNNIFDTQIAAGFAGCSAQAGYGNLLGSVLGLRVGKTASYTRWDSRPLTSEQLGYAGEDVAHLLQLADEIQSRLGERGVPAAGVGHRRAGSRHRVGTPAAGRAARPPLPRRRARAGGVA
jgi:ribonuclease D